MSGVIHLAGRADVDDDLNATLSELSCTGEGAIGSMAAGFVQKQLKEYECSGVRLTNKADQNSRETSGPLDPSEGLP